METRNPKSEGRRKAETRKGLEGATRLAANTTGYSEFGIRISDFGFGLQLAGLRPGLVRHKLGAGSPSRADTFGARSSDGPGRLAARGPRTPCSKQCNKRKY